jgi:rhodanese-related sulfurtransferase
LNRGKATKKLIHRQNHCRRVFEVEIEESKIIDVRKDTEYSAEHVEEAFSKPLASIND